MFYPYRLLLHLSAQLFSTPRIHLKMEEILAKWQTFRTFRYWLQSKSVWSPHKSKVLITHQSPPDQTRPDHVQPTIESLIQIYWPNAAVCDFFLALHAHASKLSKQNQSIFYGLSLQLATTYKLTLTASIHGWRRRRRRWVNTDHWAK